MEVFLARSLEEALALKAEHPEAVPIAGGTDLLVELNFDRRRPSAMLDVCRLPELQTWGVDGDEVRLGSGVTYSRIMRELPSFRPLAEASRSVGSPQIRNRGTVGGNLGTASPAGDALPVLAAYDARVDVVSGARGFRTLPWSDFLVGVKRNALEPDELILGARWRRTTGPGSYSKIGTRNAMVISMAGLCLVMDEPTRSVRVALGSVAPTVVRAAEAEAFVTNALGDAGVWDDPGASPPEDAVQAFGELVAAAARPIDDVRGTAAYRRHACAVLARRALGWALDDRRTASDAA